MLTSSHLDAPLTLRPLCEQQQDLDTAQEARPASPSMRKEAREGEKEEEREGQGTETRETFGSGMVSVTEASESDR